MSPGCAGMSWWIKRLQGGELSIAVTLMNLGLVYEALRTYRQVHFFFTRLIRPAEL